MKAILFASAILAASAGGALAGEGGQDYFNLALSGPPQTYAVGSAAALARPAAPVPAYARLLPGNGSMSGPETPNSLPLGATMRGHAQRKSG